jgi:hypothetical protein
MFRGYWAHGDARCAHQETREANSIESNKCLESDGPAALIEYAVHMDGVKNGVVHAEYYVPSIRSHRLATSKGRLVAADMAPPAAEVFGRIVHLSAL